MNSKCGNLKYLLVLLMFINVTRSYSQGEWYYYIKVGANHNLSVYQDIHGLTERSIKTPLGFYSLTATKPSAVELNPHGGLGFVDFTFHYPVGFHIVSPYLVTFGLEYQPVSVRNVYRTNVVDSDGFFFIMDELNTMQSLALPLFIDTRPLYNKLTAYAGVRLHVNLQNWQLQKVSWNEPPRLRKSNFGDSELKRTSLSYAVGLNFWILSAEFSIHPAIFLNQNFIDDYGRKPYSHLDNSIKSVSLSIIMGKRQKKNDKEEK